MVASIGWGWIISAHFNKVILTEHFDQFLSKNSGGIGGLSKLVRFAMHP